jgi:outer membrane protein assembly factor BamB
MPRKLLLMACLALLTLSTRLSAQGTNALWPGWHGPNRDAKSIEKNLLKTWPTGGPTLLWKTNGLGAGLASISIAGGAIFTAGARDGRLYLTALNLNGTLKWSKEIEPSVVNNYPGSRSTPTYDGGNIYIETDVGKVGCYDAATGTEKWTRRFSEFGGRLPGWAFSESVLIAGDLVIATPGGTNCIVALNKKTGETVWGSESFAPANYSSPILVDYMGAKMIVNGTGGGIVAVDAKTGKKLWSNPFAAGNTANCPTPAFADGYVFWANGYGKGGICFKLDVKDGAVTATEAWQTRDMDCHHGGYIIKDGCIYGNHGGAWSCLDLKTGEKKWQAQGVGKGSILYADGMLYLFSENNGRLGFGPASPDGFQLVGEFSVQGKGPSWAHPVIAGGRLYLRYDDNLYAFDVKARPAGSTPPPPPPKGPGAGSTPLHPKTTPMKPATR